MKIISSFYDYYDSIQGYGEFDDSVCYIRKKQTILDEECKGIFTKLFHRTSYGSLSYPFGFSMNVKKNVEFPELKYGAIFFCGKVYPFIKVCYYETFNAFTQKTKCFYDSKILEDFCAKEGFTAKSSVFRNDNNIRNISERFFERRYNFDKSVLNALHLKNNTPIISVIVDKYNEDITVNPKLADFNFYTVKDTFTAFQDIEIFFNSVLTIKEKGPGYIEDKYLMKQKGFDCYSFKKEPTKRKRKACKTKRN